MMVSSMETTQMRQVVTRIDNANTLCDWNTFSHERQPVAKAVQE